MKDRNYRTPRQLLYMARQVQRKLPLRIVDRTQENLDGTSPDCVPEDAPWVLENKQDDRICTVARIAEKQLRTYMFNN